MGSGGVALLCSAHDTLSSCSAREQVPKANEGREQNEGLRLQKGNRRCLDSELEQRVVQELQQQEAVRQPSQPATQALALCCKLTKPG